MENIKSKLSFYIIEDLSTWSDRSTIKSRLESFDTLKGAISQFKKYRENSYDQEDDKAKLTMGAVLGNFEIDIIHVRNNKNFLVSDFIGIETFKTDQEFLNNMKKIENVIGFDKIQLYKNEAGERLKEPLILDYENWNNIYFNEKNILDVSDEEMLEIIENRKPIGKFFKQEGEIFIGVDNTNGDAWTEEFKTKEECFRWLNGFEKAENLEEDDEELEM